jgi:hypothetical protein
MVMLQEGRIPAQYTQAVAVLHVILLTEGWHIMHCTRMAFCGGLLFVIDSGAE